MNTSEVITMYGPRRDDHKRVKEIIKEFKFRSKVLLTGEEDMELLKRIINYIEGK